MNYDKGFFDSPEFRALLARYEQALELNATPYFGIDELVDILSYYLFVEKYDLAAKVLDISQHIHSGATENIKMEIKLLLCNGEPTKALKIFSKLGFAEDDETKILQAEIFLALKDFKSAHEIAMSILQSAAPGQENIYDALEILLDCGFAQEALLICEKALKATPGKRSLTEVRAECLIELQRTDEAVEIYNKLLDDEPYSTLYWEQLGHVQYMVKKYIKALDCFEYESTINDDIDYPKIMQGYCYYFIGEYAKATEIFSAFSRKYPESTVPQFYDALIKYHKGETELALDAFSNIIENATEGTIEIMLARINKAIILDRCGQKEKAEEMISIALLMHPDNMKQLMLDDTYLYELRDKENLTFEDMNTLEAKEWSQAEELYKLAEHLVKHKHYALALRVFRYCREFSHDTSEIDAYIAYLLWNTGEKEKSVHAIRNAIEGKSWTLFKLFGVPYKSNITTKEFTEAIEKKD
jgi:tetratricopeptide (TPR) repeat protein